MKKRLISLVSLCAILLSLCSCNTQKVDFSYFDNNFSPFFVRGFQDMSVVALTQEPLIVTSDDESASIITDANTQGLGISDVDIEYGDGVSVCTVKLGQDIYFSNGTKLTSKDVAFSMYVCAQPDYDGWSQLKYSALDGLSEYWYGTTAVADIVIAEEQLDLELANPSERTKDLIASRIINPILREEYKWVTHLYNDKSYIGTDVETHVKQYPDPRALFAFYYSTDKSYDPLAVEDSQTVVDDIASQYGADYETLGRVYGTDLSEMAKLCAREALTENALENNESGQKVSAISGIEIVDDFTLKITINSVSESQIKDVLGVYVAPFDYYGTDCTFDGKGFVIDSQSVGEKSALPQGAGRYVFKSYKTGSGVKLAYNTNYYRETTDKKQPLFLKETGDSSYSYDNQYMVTNDDRLSVRK